MIPFSQYILNFKRKYVCVRFSEETNELLYAYTRLYGFDTTKSYSGDDIDDFDFHATVFYSETYHDIPNTDVEFDEPFYLTPIGLELFGENKNIPVILLGTSDELQEIRDVFEEQGFGDKFPDYRPHISLSYNYNGGNLDDIPLPVFDIRVDTMSIEDIKDS